MMTMMNKIVSKKASKNRHYTKEEALDMIDDTLEYIQSIFDLKFGFEHDAFSL